MGVPKGGRMQLPAIASLRQPQLLGRPTPFRAVQNGSSSQGRLRRWRVQVASELAGEVDAALVRHVGFKQSRPLYRMNA